MRTLLMAGTALMFMGGVALAQSTAGSTPAVGGQSNATASGQTSGTAAGTMTPKANSSMSNPSGTASSGTMGQAGSMSKEGMKKPSETMAPRHAMMRHTTMGHNSAYISHHMGGNMPVGASAGTYLHIAQRAVMAHNKAHAQVALGRAETDLLTNSYVQGSVNGPINSPAISAVRDARRAVKSGQYQNASMMIHKAMTEMHGGMGNGAQSGGMMGKPGGMMQNPGMAPSTGTQLPPKSGSSM